MKRIEISNSILYIHKLFCTQFKDKIPDKIYVEQITIDEIKKIEKDKLNKNPEYDYDVNIIKMTHKSCEEAHKEIIKFYKSEENYKDFIIGDPDKLYNLIKDMEKLRLYNIFQMMVKFKIKVKINNDPKSKSFIYSNLLIDKLGYSKFTEIRITVDDDTNIYSTDLKELIPTDIENDKEEEWFEYLKLLYIKLNMSKKDIKNNSVKKLINCWGAYPFAFSLDVTVCPYCNKQYIEPIYTNKGKMRGDMDHFYSKELYPLFSISIYNLVPVCGFCNSSFKGTKNFELADIHPYRESIDESFNFKFKLHGDSIKVYTKKNLEPGVKTNGVDRYNDYFKYEKQYQYHENLVKEFIMKTRMYNDDVVENLREKFNIYNLSSKQIKEQIYGYRMDDKDLNKKTLAKFAKDILLQLNSEEKNHDNIQLTIEERSKLLEKLNK
ncbi:hypothetical protein [Clostridium butyricum]